MIAYKLQGDLQRLEFLTNNAGIHGIMEINEIIIISLKILDYVVPHITLTKDQD